MNRIVVYFGHCFQDVFGKEGIFSASSRVYSKLSLHLLSSTDNPICGQEPLHLVALVMYDHVPVDIWWGPQTYTDTAFLPSSVTFRDLQRRFFNVKRPF